MTSGQLPFATPCMGDTYKTEFDHPKLLDRELPKSEERIIMDEFVRYALAFWLGSSFVMSGIMQPTDVFRYSFPYRARKKT